MRSEIENQMPIYVDHTHLGRHVTGLERITLELFSAASLAPLDIVPVVASGTGQLIMTQTFGLPWRMAASSSLLLCPRLSAECIVASVCFTRHSLYSRRVFAITAAGSQLESEALHGRAIQTRGPKLSAFLRELGRYQAKAHRTLPA